MTEPILLQFIDKIYSKNHDYCVICLRTHTERRLEKPKYLKSFLQSINKAPFEKKNQLVCYVCERQAAAASRFVSAANLAIHAHNVMRWLQDNPALCSKFKSKYFIYDFQTPLTDDNMYPERLRTVAQALDCEARLQRQSLCTQLLQTDVLTISTPSFKSQDAAPDISTPKADISATVLGNYTGPMPPRPGESSNLYVVPDITTSPLNITDAFQLIDDPETKMESIIIFDDDDLIGTPTESTQETGTNSTLIDDSKKETDGAFKAIPIDKLIDRSFNETSPVAKEQETSSTHFILHPIVFNSGMMTVPSMSATIINGQLMTANESNIIVETPKVALQTGENIDFISDPDKVTSLLKKLSHQDAGTVHILTIACPETVSLLDQAKSVAKSVTGNDSTFVVNKKVKVNNNVIPQSVNKSIEHSNTSVCMVTDCDSQEKGKNSRGPNLGSDRIDWEDKIPMDLISFVDDHENSSKRARRAACDPLAMGIISSVTSLSEAPPDDVIDLC